MKQSYSTTQNSPLHLKKIKHADEKKFNLRKAIYEIDRLSYERGTRSGDYLIREKIQSINEELGLFDSKIKTCESGPGNSSLYREILLFFEGRFFDDFSLNEKIYLLKQELADQEKADAEHNAAHKDGKYKRKGANIFRDELEKDLKSFEYALINTIIPSLKAFLTDINDLLFYNAINDKIEKWPVKDSSEDQDISYIEFKSDINFFIRINSKIQNKLFIVKEAIALVDFLLSEMEIKSKLLNHLNIDEKGFYKIITDSARQYCDYRGRPENFNTDGIKPSHLYEKGTQDDSQRRVQIALKNLQYLTEYKNTKINIALPENLSKNRIKKYLFSSPGSGKILLKDVADYLRDSLLFINEWLLIELKKSQDSYDYLKSLVDCLPAEISFYNLLEVANYTAAQENNRKTNIWGDLTQYISIEAAEDIIHSIDSICEELKDAFIKTILDIELNKSADNIKLAKKTNIIYDSFENARKKIIIEVRFLEK